jgi:hypothetical protein
MENAPNAEKRTDSSTISTKNGNEVSLIFNTIALLFFKLLTVLTDFLLALVERVERRTSQSTRITKSKGDTTLISKQRQS